MELTEFVGGYLQANREKSANAYQQEELRELAEKKAIAVAVGHESSIISEDVKRFPTNLIDAREVCWSDDGLSMTVKLFAFTPERSWLGEKYVYRNSSHERWIMLAKYDITFEDCGDSDQPDYSRFQTVRSPDTQYLYRGTSSNSFSQALGRWMRDQGDQIWLWLDNVEIPLAVKLAIMIGGTVSAENPMSIDFYYDGLASQAVSYCQEEVDALADLMRQEGVAHLELSVVEPEVFRVSMINNESRLLVHIRP